MSASCSIEPDSLKSDNIGRLSVRLSGPLESCDSSIIGTFKSLAITLTFLVISETIVTLLSERRLDDIS